MSHYKELVLAVTDRIEEENREAKYTTKAELETVSELLKATSQEKM